MAFLHFHHGGGSPLAMLLIFLITLAVFVFLASAKDKPEK